VQRRWLRFWIAYARAALFFFVALLALDWLAYLLLERWFELWAILAIAGVLPGLGLKVTWD
jgi:hypothetical protein